MGEALNVALIHEWMVTLGGSERVVWAMHEVYPHAPVYTSVYQPRNLPEEFQKLAIHPSFLQNFPACGRYYQKLLPLMPLAFEQFDLRDYDVVISSHHACAKGVITGPETLHISYVHTPMRYAWDLYHDYQATLPRLMRPVSAALLHRLRTWDVVTANRVDHFIANSHTVARRIEKHYRRPATVIHPPVDVERFSIAPRVDDHFLVVSRLVPYKRVDLAIEAFNKLGWPLRVVGDGPLYRELRKLAKPNITFAGHLSDQEVAVELSQARALIFPAFEDFGIVPVEAQAAGRPVIAYGHGGATETVLDGVSGVFFPEQTADSLVDALRRFDALSFDAEIIRRHALKFSRLNFQEALGRFVAEAYAEKKRELIHG